MDPQDLSILKSLFAFRGIVTELSNPQFTNNLDSNEKVSISNLLKSILADLKQYQGSHKDIKYQINQSLLTIPDLQRFDNSIS